MRALAVVFLSATIANRMAIAERMLEAIRANDPEGDYVIESRTGEAGKSFVRPPADEDWEFQIVVRRTTSNVAIKPRPFLPPLLTGEDDG